MASRRRISSARRSASSDPAPSSLDRDRSGSPTSAAGPPPTSAQNEAPAWAQHLLAQVAELKSQSTTGFRQERDAGDASDTDTEFARPAHKDQYQHNKRLLSVFEHIKANPARAVELAEKGKTIVESRQKHIRIADVDGWDTVRIFQKRPIVDNEADKRRLKEAREQALATRRKSFPGKRRDRSPRGSRRDRSRSPLSRSPSPTKRAWRSERIFRTSARERRHDPFVCFECGQEGHVKRFCPQRRTEVGERGARFRPQHGAEGGERPVV